MLFDKLMFTGASGDIAVALAQLARAEGIAERMIGLDARPDPAVASVYDTLETIAPAEDIAYQDTLARLIERHQPDLLIPGSEAELARLLSDNMLQQAHGVAVLAANPRAVQIGLDKFETVRQLQHSGIPMPWTGIVGRDEPTALPCIIKPRRGQGSKGLAIAYETNVEELSQQAGEYIWQELLPEDDQEYTCGLYGSKGGELLTISFRRTLQGGLTGHAELVQNDAIEAVLGRVAWALKLRGAINVQLRLNEGEPFIFEINPRFSSTVGFRHLAGFRDFLWSLQEAAGAQLESYRAPSGPLVFKRDNSKLAAEREISLSS